MHEPPSLLYLSRADLLRLGADASQPYVEAVARGLAAHARGRHVQPLKPYLRWPGADHIADRIIAMPAYVDAGVPIAGIKWIGSRAHNPSRFGLERASALIVLNDPETNHPVAILEGALISGMRTAAVTVVAARHLAPPDFRALAVIGCGPVGGHHIKSFLEQFPSIRAVHLHDAVPEAAARLARSFQARFPGVRFCVEPGPEEAVAAGETVVTCTVAPAPWLRWSWLRTGAFLANVSIMDAEKEVFERAHKVVVDDWDQCNREGKVICQLVQEGRFSRDRLHAQLGEIVVGDRPGREAPDETILLNPMGMAIGDIVCADHFHRAARARGAGTLLPLLA